MSTNSSTEVRLVRCPNCLQVLPELPDVLLYKCGGCGTILQAKKRKQDKNHAELSSQDTDSVVESQQDNVLEEKEARTSDHDLRSPPETESSPDKDNLRCQEEHGNCSKELREETSVSENLSSSPEVDRPRDSPVEVEESWKRDGHLGQSSKSYYSKFGDDNTEWNRSRNFSNELYSSDEFPHNAEEYASEESEHVEKQKESYLHQENGVDENERSALPPDSENREGIKNTSSGIVSHENIEDDVVVEGKNMHASVDDCIVASRSPLDESLVSVYLTSPDDEHLDRSLREETRKFGRISSIDTMDSSELNFKHQSMSKYPTSGSYYGYDGSESSYDGTDSQLCENIPYRLRKGKDVGYISTTPRVNKVIHSEREMNYWAASSSSHREAKSNHWRQERSRYKQGEVSRTLNSSSYQHNLLPPRPRFNKPSYLEPDKIELLRTVHELKDQLNRMQFSTVAQKNRFSHSHYYHSAPEREIYADYPKVYAKRGNVSGMGFSGEAAHCRSHNSCSCLHCYPQECRYSAHLPSNCTHCTNSHCTSSNSSSPRHYMRRDDVKRLHLKEKAKRHLRPVAGGPPMVACYHCWELLQLPADFLLFKKRYHQLMCNACKKVLKFSLTKGNHLVPYLPSASAPPPSEIDGYNDATTSRENLDRRSEPVSYSDDYGRSFSLKENRYDRKLSSSSCEPMQDRKMKSVLIEHENKNGSLVKTVESSSNVQNWGNGTSEIEEVQPSSSSLLHRLMGYSSPSQVLK